MKYRMSEGMTNIGTPLKEAMERTPRPKEPEQEPLISKDAYDGAREDLAIWKKRALEAEELNRKFIAEINGPTHMGEPVRPEQKPVTPFGLPLFWDAPLINEGTKEPEKEPVGMYRNKCADGSRCLHGCHTNESCFISSQPQPEQKPVAWAWRFHEGDWVVGVELPWFAERSGYEHRPLVFSNITPPQRKPLTDEQIRQVMINANLNYDGFADVLVARAIEAAHGIKE